jgi:N-acetylneuraminate synthase
MTGFRIGDRRVGPDDPPFVMAEVGINHEGSFEKAVQLGPAAAESGADCVKFQTHITEMEMVPTDMKPGDISDERLWDIIKRCELSAEEERAVKDHCDEKGILFLSTPFSREASDRLEDLGVPAYKIGSGECNNVPLIEHVARKGKPIILSTGMNDISTIRASVEAVQRLGTPLMLMHCVSMYPTPYGSVHLRAIQDLQREFGLAVGLSDHSIGIYTCLGGVALGACALEKHFTISRSWPGPDVPISIEPDELRDLVVGSRAVWQSMSGGKEIQPGEQPVIDFAYASVVSIAPIAAGDTLSLDNIWVKRPGTGEFLAKDLETVLGRRAARDIPAEVQIRAEDLA